MGRMQMQRHLARSVFFRSLDVGGCEEHGHAVFQADAAAGVIARVPPDGTRRWTEKVRLKKLSNGTGLDRTALTAMSVRHAHPARCAQHAPQHIASRAGIVVDNTASLP